MVRDQNHPRQAPSTSTSRAVIIPARNTTSAISGCRLQGAGNEEETTGRGLSRHVGGGSDRRRGRPRNLSRHQGRGRAVDDRADPQGLSRARASSEESFIDLRAAARDRRVENAGRAGRPSNGSPHLPIPSFLPEKAPFAPEQRVGSTVCSPACRVRTRRHAAVQAGRRQRSGCGLDLTGNAQVGAAEERDDDAPWHDPAMELAERMKLAEGRVPAPPVDGGNGTTDCGQCGYNCQDYSDAIYSQKEENARSLRARWQGDHPHAQGIAGSGVGQFAAASGGQGTERQRSRLPMFTAAPAVAPGCSRESPAEGPAFCLGTRLNKPGSAKETWHIEFDLTGVWHRLRRWRCVRRVRRQRPGPCRRSDRGAWRTG